MECRNDAKAVSVVKSNTSKSTTNYMLIIEEFQAYENIPAWFQLFCNSAYFRQGR